MPEMPKIWGNSEKASTHSPEMKSVMINSNNAQSNMQSARGLNTSNLFSEKIRSDSARLDRLENYVQSIRNELDTMHPSVDRLVAIEGDVQTLIKQLEVIAQGNNNSMHTPTNNMVSKETSTPEAPKQNNSSANTNNNASINSVRVGEHPGKTRIVLDVSAPVNFSANIDNNEDILTIEVPNANWNTEKQRTLKNSKFISSYKVEQSSQNNGFIIIAQLKKAATISYKGSIKAISGNGRRIVIDIAN